MKMFFKKVKFFIGLIGAIIFLQVFIPDLLLNALFGNKEASNDE